MKSVPVWILTAGLALAALVPAAYALRPDPADSREIVVYTRGIAEIREMRTVSVEKGEGELLLPMLPDGTFGSTVRVEVIRPKGVSSHSASFAYDEVDENKIWESRVGEHVELVLPEDSLVSGVLRRVGAGKFFLELDDPPGRIAVIEQSEVKDPLLDYLPGGLVFEPSVRWIYDAKRAGEARIELSYLCSDVNWSADYLLEMEKDRGHFVGNAVLENMSGLNLAYDRLVLVAGSIHLAGDSRRVDRLNPKPGASEYVRESGFGDVRRWTFEQPGMMYTGHETVIPFVDVSRVDLETRYVYDATIFNDRVTTHLELTLSGKNAKPLPSGNVRMYRREKDGILFIGEDGIDNTPAGSPLDLTVAQAFDFSAERTREKEEPLPDGGTAQRFKVKLGNSGAEDINIDVLERMFGAWTVTEAVLDGEAIDHRVKDARTAEFNVPVPSGKTVALEYEIHYRR